MSEQIENRDYGADFVGAAVRVAQTIDGFEEQGEILSSAASIYAESGQIDLAVDLAETIDDSIQRDLALTKIAATCARTDDGDQAESVLDMIEDEAAHGLAIEQIAAGYARSGKIDKAVEIAQRLSDSASALSNIALACPKDLLADSIDLAHSIEYPELKATTLVELAIKARSLEKESDSAELIEAAELAAEKIDLPLRRIETRVAIAAWYKDENQPEQAAGLLSKTRRDCNETKGLDRDVALSQIAAAYAELREFDSADQLLEAIEDPFQFSFASAGVAFEHYQAGDETAAIKLLADGFEVVNDEPVYGPETRNAREIVLGKFARTYSAIGRIEDALRMVDLLDSQEQRDAALRDVAVKSASTDNPGTAFKVFDKIENDSLRVICEVEVVRALTRPDQLALANHILAQASADVAKIERPQQRAKCLAELAQAYELCEQTSRAAENLCEALKAAAMIKGSYMQARALLGLAVKHQELTQPASEQELSILEEITNRLD